MEEFIQSRQNPRVKSLMKLRDRAERRRLGLFAVEGLRELSRCVGLSDVEEIYYCPGTVNLSKKSPPKKRSRSAASRRGLLKKSQTARGATGSSGWCGSGDARFRTSSFRKVAPRRYSWRTP